MTPEQTQLVEENLQVAYRIAKRFYQLRPWIDHDDCVSEATYQLTLAALEFDPTKGLPSRFIAFAIRRIRWGLSMLLRNRQAMKREYHRTRQELKEDVRDREPTDYQDSKDTLKEVLALASSKQQKACAVVMEVGTVRGAAGRLGITHQAVFALLRTLRDNYLRQEQEHGSGATPIHQANNVPDLRFGQSGGPIHAGGAVR